MHMYMYMYTAVHLKLTQYSIILQNKIKTKKKKDF